MEYLFTPGLNGPMSETGFWNQHPEWRAKNALLQDAEIEFLQLMDLQNPECLKTALNDLELLLKEDWDGVDVAEFTITARWQRHSQDLIARITLSALGRQHVQNSSRLQASILLNSKIQLPGITGCATQLP